MKIILILILLLSACAAPQKPISDNAERVYACILSEGRDQPQFCREMEAGR